MADISDKIGKQEAGLDPLINFFRRLELEKLAKEQNSDLYCPYCRTNLPYNKMTVGQECSGEFDADGRPLIQTIYFCTICEKNFY